MSDKERRRGGERRGEEGKGGERRGEEGEGDILGVGTVHDD